MKQFPWHDNRLFDYFNCSNLTFINKNNVQWLIDCSCHSPALIKHVIKIFVMIKYYSWKRFFFEIGLIYRQMDELQIYFANFRNSNVFLAKKHFRGNGSFCSFLRAFVLLIVSRLITFMSFWHQSNEFKIYAILFLLFSIVLTRKISYVPILDSTCRYSFDKCRFETKKRWPIPWKSRIFHPRILEELVRICANLPFGLWKSLTELEEKFCWFKGR